MVTLFLQYQLHNLQIVQNQLLPFVELHSHQGLVQNLNKPANRINLTLLDLAKKTLIIN